MKRFISIATALIILMSQINVFCTQISYKGKYVKFGTYNGQDVIYYIADYNDVNNDGVKDYTLLSADILMFKGFDTASSLWSKSTLRKWLNSDASDISWGAKVPSASVFPQHPYDNEPGFLTGMTENEKNMLIDVTHKSVSYSKDISDGGTAQLIWNSGDFTDYRFALQNYDNAYYLSSTDRVFIPSIKDLVDLDLPLGVVAASFYVDENGNRAESKNSAALLRDACEQKTVRYYYRYNTIHATGITNESAGVRPMLCVDGKSTALCGDGTKDNPCYFEGSRYGFGMYAANCVKSGNMYTAEFKNLCYEDRTVNFVAAVYQDGSRLKNIYTDGATVFSGRRKTLSISIPEADSENCTVKVMYWSNFDSIIPLNPRNESYSEVRELEPSADFTLKNREIQISSSYRFEYAFDDLGKTSFAISNMGENEVEIQFNYPTEVKTVSLAPVLNGDWAVPGKIEILTYNDENIYRYKDKNKEPVSLGTFPVKYSSSLQTFNLSGAEGITHLILKFSQLNISATTAVWGGFHTMKLTGCVKKDDIPTSKIITGKIVPNSEILERFMPSKNLTEYAVVCDTEAFINAVSDITGKAAVLTGDGEGYISAQGFYDCVLGMLDSDITQLRKSGGGSLYGISPLTVKDLLIAMYEVLDVPLDNEKTLGKLMYESGYLSQVMYGHYVDKNDIITGLKEGNFELLPTSIVDNSFSFFKDTSKKLMTNVNFAYNMPFHYGGTYYGTLPVSDSRSKRAEFVEKLKTVGIKALRFPGGIPCHQYLPDGSDYVNTLCDSIKSSPIGVDFGGYYDSTDTNSNYYVEFYNFLDFCNDCGIEPIYQVNTSFYADKIAEKPRAIIKNMYVTDTDGNCNESLYDRDRTEEAAAALAQNIDEMLAAGYTVKYWEIGNEDFATANYMKTSVADENNPAADNYMKVLAAFSAVIKEKIPGAFVIATGGFENMEQKMREAGCFDKVDSISTHYPFGVWTTPSADDKDNLSVFAVKNECDFVSNYIGRNTVYTKDLCTTETSLWKYESWNSAGLTNSFAMAINNAHQLGELIFETNQSICVVHDLESPYFGSILYNVAINPQNKYLHFADTENDISADDTPDDYFMNDEYFINPSGYAFKHISRHCNQYALVQDDTSQYKMISVFASYDADKITVTIVNKMNVIEDIAIDFNGFDILRQMVKSDVMSSDVLSAVLEREYKNEQVNIIVNGNSGEHDITLKIRPYSIYTFDIQL